MPTLNISILVGITTLIIIVNTKIKIKQHIQNTSNLVGIIPKKQWKNISIKIDNIKLNVCK